MTDGTVEVKDVFWWLEENLPGRTSGLTGTDCDVLRAVVGIVPVWLRTMSPASAMAFAAVVSHMQPKYQFMAYHAIAMVGDWSHRAALWNMARLEWDIPGDDDDSNQLESDGHFPPCKHEPGMRTVIRASS